MPRSLVSRSSSAARTLVSGRGTGSAALVPGPVAPVISGITASPVGQTTATIGWSVDQPSTGQVNYGTTASYGSSTTAETGRYTRHAQAITGLNSNTTYHYRVRSTDIDGLETVSGDNTFTTLASSTFDSGMTYTDFVPPSTITAIADLQSWLDANVKNAAGSWTTTNHKRVLLGAGRTYTGSIGLQIAGYSHVTFEGGGTETSGTDGAVTYGGQTGGARLILTGSPSSTASSAFRSASGAATPASDIRFHALGITGSSTNYASTTAGDGGEFQMAWCLYGASTILIDHCTADRIKGDGIYMADRLSGSGTWCSGITMRYSTISNNGRMGLGIIAVNGLTVTNCRFTDICYAVLDIEPNVSGQGCSDVEISDCLIDGTYFSWDITYEDGCFVTANAGVTGVTVSGYLRILRNRITAAMKPDNLSQYTGHFRLYYPSAVTKTAVLTIEDNVCTAPKAQYACLVGGFSSGGSIQRNTGFLTSGTFYNNQGGNGSFTISGNT